MIDDLDTNTSVVVWVALGYLVAATGPMLFMARVADAVGRARMFGLGTLVYGAAMIACGFASEISTLVTLRLIQGFGMAMFLPATFTLATEVYPPQQRGKALGLMASGNAFGFVLGPVFAGWLLDAYDWHAIFLSRIPLAIVAVILGFVVFGKSVGQQKTRRNHYDTAGALLLTLSLFGLLFGFNRLPVEDNHLDWTVWSVFIFGVVLFPFFIRQEKKSPDPLVDVNLFRKSARFTRAGIAYTAMFASFPVELFVLPIVLMVGLEMRPWTVGMIMAVVAVITFVISPYAGKLADRMGAEKICTTGTVLMIIGYLLMGTIQSSESIGILLSAMVLMGVGSGLFFSPNNSLIMTNAPPERQAMASGLIGTFRQTGYAVGFAIIASMFTAVQDLFETTWAGTGVGVVSSSTAREIANFFEQGGVWSPEVLLYIFRLTVILCAAILILTLIYSVPQRKIRRFYHSFAFVSTLVIAVGGMTVFAANTALNIQPKPEIEGSHTEQPREEVLAFGRGSREEVDIAMRAAMQTGEDLYNENCAVCHGYQLEGLPDLGVHLMGNPFVRDGTLAELINHLREGRPINHPHNTTGRIMPGFRDFSEHELRQIAVYVRGQSKAK